MNNFNGVRNRRSLLDFRGCTPLQFPITNYSTSAQTKTEMKHTFEDRILINNLHLIPDPLKKNLADSVITGEDNKPKMGNTNEFVTRGPEKPNKTNMGNTNQVVPMGPEMPDQRDYYPSLAGITSFFSGVFSVMGAMFQKRATSPVPQYYDCFENEYDERQTASNPWHSSKFEVQNKNEWAQLSNDCKTNLDVQMNTDCRIATSHCEDKLNRVCLLLENTQKSNSMSRFKSKHPNMTFIEAGSVENSYEEALPSEDTLLANETSVQYNCPYSYQDEELYETGSPKVKTELVNGSFNVIQNLPEIPLLVENEIKTEPSENINVTKDTLTEENIEEPIKTPGIVSSCEDKLNRLKALLKTCHNKNKDISLSNVDVSKPVDIPNTNTKIINNHQTETMFFNEINSPDLKNTNCFNEVTGKFYSSSIESEDSFQIVFTDNPQNVEYIRRLPSDCESEDSFIMFEETPDSCYTYNDVFGDDADQDSSDSDCDTEDSECISKLSPNLSRTFGDLTDNSLYSEDVVDYSVSMCDQTNDSRQKCTGLLLNEKRKLEKKRQPTKTVHFSTQPPKVHVMRVWAFAARQARAGHWERHALDRERFKRRIADVEMALSWVLKPQHRSRIVFQRFMPWWNAEKRRELAEKKIKEEDRRVSVNSARVNGDSATTDNCDGVDEVTDKTIASHLFANNNIVDDNNSNIHKHIHSKTDNDQLDVSVKNNIDETITEQFNGDVLDKQNITNFDT